VFWGDFFFWGGFFVVGLVGGNFYSDERKGRHMTSKTERVRA